MDSLPVTTDEAATEVNVLEVVFFRLEVRNLAYVVAVMDVSIKSATPDRTLLTTQHKADSG